MGIIPLIFLFIFGTLLSLFVPKPIRPLFLLVTIGYVVWVGFFATGNIEMSALHFISEDVGEPPAPEGCWEELATKGYNNETIKQLCTVRARNDDK